jgi:hypothetical protein
LILKAVVCCLKIRRTISGNVDSVISCKVKLYLFDHPIGARVVLPDHILKNKPQPRPITDSIYNNKTWPLQTSRVWQSPLETSPSLLLFWWGVEHQTIWRCSG